MTDTPELVIRISPGQLAESMDLRRTTALEGCTNIDGDDAGMFIAKRWPRLSSGEECLWQLLAWVNGHSERPTDAVLRAVLDDANYAAVAGVGAP